MNYMDWEIIVSDLMLHEQWIFSLLSSWSWTDSVRKQSLERVELLFGQGKEWWSPVCGFLESCSDESLKFQILRCLIERVVAARKTLANESFSINITPMDIIHVDFMDEISKLWKHFQTGRLTLEITEQEIPEWGKGLFLQKVSELKKLWFQISVDDFWANYSNFERVSILANVWWLDEIKLDIWVFQDLYDLYNQGKNVSVQSTERITFCGEDIQVWGLINIIHWYEEVNFIVEWIENEEQALFAVDILRANMLQWFHVHRPEPLKANLQLSNPTISSMIFVSNDWFSLDYSNKLNFISYLEYPMLLPSFTQDVIAKVIKELIWYKEYAQWFRNTGEILDELWDTAEEKISEFDQGIRVIKESLSEYDGSEEAQQKLRTHVESFQTRFFSVEELKQGKKPRWDWRREKKKAA